MAKTSSSSTLLVSPFSLFLPRRDIIAVLSILSLLLHHLSASPANHHLEGFDADEEDGESEILLPPLRSSPPSISLSQSPPSHSHRNNPNSDSDSDSDPNPSPNPNPNSAPSTTTSASSFDDHYWDEDEFEGIPQNVNPPISEDLPDAESKAATLLSQPESDNNSHSSDVKSPFKLSSYSIEIACVSFLIVFVINYFTGKRQNENLALAWATKFATKDSIFDKNFSLLGVGETDDSPLLLQEGHNVYKFYATGRRFCLGMLATMELKSRHDLISRLYNMAVSSKDEITFEVYMNDDAMDQVVFALARKKLAKTMHKEFRDLQRFAGLVAVPNGRKWVAEELQVLSESKEVAGDLINDTVLDQVFGDKAFEKLGKSFISMHFSDQHLGSSKKMLVFKFVLPDVNHMSDMARLVALVPYYIDLIGRYKLSPHARSKTDAARTKVAQENYRELQNARQEALQKKKADQRKKLEEAEAKLSAEALRKKEAKERSRQVKKGMPKIKMSR